MTRILLTALFGVFSLCASAQAVLKLEKTNHDFGQFAESQVQKAVFSFTNAGDKPLVIQQAFSSCGCTIPEFTKTPVQPGQKGEIVVVYNGRDKAEGHFKKAVTIRTNASNPLARVYVEGTMKK